MHDRRAVVDAAEEGAYFKRVAICYRIAGHVKYSAKEGPGIWPRHLVVAGVYLWLETRDEQRLENTHATGA